MTITRVLTSFAVAATLAVAATPARAAQRRDNDKQNAQQQHGTAVPRAESRGNAVAPPRTVTARPNTVIRREDVVRSAPTFRGRTSYAAPRVLAPRSFIIGGPSFYRPYYSFRPHLSLGFGLWLGYPVAYPYYDVPYVYSYGYAPGYDYGYSTPGYSTPSYSTPSYPAYSGDLTPTTGSEAAPGGLSFAISPSTAAVFVDGTFVGTAAEFGPTAQPLGLIPGRHHIEIRADGFRTMSFDADVTAGQVLPYQGTLQR